MDIEKFKKKFGEQLIAKLVNETNDPTGMNIIEAMEILKTGRVRRKNWPLGSFLETENGCGINFCGKHERFPYTWRPVIDDLTSTNWVSA